MLINIINEIERLKYFSGKSVNVCITSTFFMAKYLLININFSEFSSFRVSIRKKKKKKKLSIFLA